MFFHSLNLEETWKNASDKLYNMGTFWMPQKDGFFILREKKRPSAEDMYNARLFYWDPDHLAADGLHCPSCGFKLQRHGYTIVYHHPGQT
jgi:hypothetical protein